MGWELWVLDRFQYVRSVWYSQLQTAPDWCVGGNLFRLFRILHLNNKNYQVGKKKNVIFVGLVGGDGGSTKLREWWGNKRAAECRWKGRRRRRRRAARFDFNHASRVSMFLFRANASYRITFLDICQTLYLNVSPLIIATCWMCVDTLFAVAGWFSW